MKKRKKLFTCLLSLTLIFTMIPLTAKPANAAVSLTALYITDSKGGTSEAIDITQETIVDSSGGWKWEKATSTLTLDGFDGEYIEANGDLNIVVKRSNTVTIPANPDKNYVYGINITSGELKITGEGTTPSLTVTQTGFSKESLSVEGIDGRDGLVVTDCELKIRFDGTEAYAGIGILSSNGRFELKGTSSLDIELKNGQEYTQGIGRGVYASTSGDISIAVDGVGKKCFGVGGLFAYGSGNVYIRVPKGRAINGSLVISEGAGNIEFEGFLYLDSYEDSAFSRKSSFEIPGNKKIIKVDASGSEVAGKCGFIYKEFTNLDYGVYLLDEDGNKVAKGKIITQANNPLAFMHSDVLDMGTLEVGTSYRGKKFHGLVSGGKAPYTFTVENLPDGLNLFQYNDYIDFFAYIAGEPTTPGLGGIITLTVTDANNMSDSISIEYDGIIKPPKYITVGEDKFEDSQNMTPTTGNWSYEAETKTLTLNSYKGGIIKSEEGLNIKVKGNNTITIPANPPATVCGINTESGILTIKGEGSSPTLNILQTNLSREGSLYATGIDGRDGLEITDCSVKIKLNGAQQYDANGIGSSNGDFYLNGMASLDIDIKNAGNYSYGIGRGVRANTSGNIVVKVDGPGNPIVGISALYTLGSGDINISVPKGRAIGGPINISENAGTIYFDGSLKISHSDEEIFTYSDRFTIPSNKKIVKVDGSGNEITGKCGFIYKEFTSGDDGVYLVDEAGNKVVKGKIKTQANNPLSFMKSDVLDIETLEVDKYYRGKKIHGLVSGGKAPYKFTAKDLPEGLKLVESSRPDEFYAYVAGTPTAEQPAGTFTLTVTDANNATASIPVQYGAVTVPKGVTGLTLNESELTLANGSTATLTATVTPDDATIKTVLWSSSNASVARVDDNGNIKTYAPGKTVITATTKQGNFSESCTVYVKEDKPNATINYQYETLKGLKINEEYRISGDGVNDTFNVTDISYPIKDTWFGKTLTLTKTNAEPESSSDEQVLIIPARPAAPAGIGTVDASAYCDANDGKITGVAVGMQYCVRGTQNWYPVEGSEVTGLGRGEYEIRVARTESSFRGHPTFVTIGYKSLTLAGDIAYEIPEGVVETEIEEVDISKAVKGGRTPYIFTKESGPDWLQVDWQGKITGTRPSTETAATTATIKVTDADKTSQTFSIAVGAVTLPKGYDITGRVESYNPNVKPTIKLMQGNVKAYDVDSADIVAESTVGGKIIHKFTFKNVLPGTYDLVVTKDAHLKYTIKNVVVGDTPLDLMTQANAAISTMTLLCGDVDENGYINSTDLGIILKGQNYGKPSNTAGVEPAADLDGNGYINSTDLGIVLQGQHYGKSAVSVDYA